MNSEPVGDVALGLSEIKAEIEQSVSDVLSPLADGNRVTREPATVAENMALWKSVEQTDPKYVTPIPGTDLSKVDATYQKMRATQLWGPYGNLWGLRDIELGQVPETGLPAELWGNAIFFCPYTKFQIIDDIAWRRGDDCRKKLMTRMLKKALSYLGFSALIYMGETDDDGASHEATEEQEKIFVLLKQGAETANNEKALQFVQQRAVEKRLSRFHRESLAAVCAERAIHLGVEVRAR